MRLNTKCKRNTLKRRRQPALAVLAVCAGLLFSLGVAAEAESDAMPPLLTLRFANPDYDSTTGVYCLDVELQSDTENQELFGMNARFFYESSALDFIGFTDFQGGYGGVNPSPPQVHAGAPETGPDMFGFEGAAVYVNGAIQLVDYGAPPVFISTSEWTKVFSVCFSVVDLDLVHGDSFCPCVVWDLEAETDKGGFLRGSSGVVMTVLAEPPMESASVNRAAVQFNGQYEKSGEGAFILPVSSSCVLVDYAELEPVEGELESHTDAGDDDAEPDDTSVESDDGAAEEDDSVPGEEVAVIVDDVEPVVGESDAGVDSESVTAQDDRQSGAGDGEADDAPTIIEDVTDEVTPVDNRSALIANDEVDSAGGCNGCGFGGTKSLLDWLADWLLIGVSMLVLFTLKGVRKQD